ncbi:alpha/beta fold hydrolase [Oricola sp.]|uniref:alpha/beta fold hydrolase n=1 Tax=Oricola sp. TaxID=1979950 RepID=UPI003BAA9DD0
MTTLRQTESNPLPDTDAAGFVRTPDGFSIRYAVCKAAGSAKGTIILLHGRNETIEKYTETVRDLRDTAMDIVTFDWRGQGGSDRFFRNGGPGYIDDFEQYSIDLDTIFREIVLPDCRPPYHIIAHSTGCLIALYSAPVMANRIRRMVLSAPLLGLPVPATQNALARFVAGVLCFIGLGNIYLAGGPPKQLRQPFETNALTSDPDRYARNVELVEQHPDLALGGPTPAWTSATFRALDAIRRPAHMAATTIPTLIVAAGRDTVVSNAACESHSRRLRSASMLTINGAKHEIFQEADIYRRQLLAAIRAFIPGTED